MVHSQVKIKGRHISRKKKEKKKKAETATPEIFDGISADDYIGLCMYSSTVKIEVIILHHYSYLRQERADRGIRLLQRVCATQLRIGDDDDVWTESVITATSVLRMWKRNKRYPFRQLNHIIIVARTSKTQTAAASAAVAMTALSTTTTMTTTTTKLSYHRTSTAHRHRSVRS